MRSCIMPGLPTHLVQELDVGTVGRIVPKRVQLVKASTKGVYILYIIQSH